jgi:hypothetical protein
MGRPGGRRRAVSWLAALCALYACGGEGEGDGGGGGGGAQVGGGEVRAPWNSACVATFDQDYDFIDPFDEVELQVVAGSRYLLADVGGFGAQATVLYLSDVGPVEFAIENDGNPPPFSSSCAGGVVEEVVGVFANVTVYSDQALNMAACMLSAGDVLPGGGLSYALVSGDLFAGGGTYEVSFGGLATACDGLDAGYVAASSVMLGETQYTVLPLASVLRPGS